MSIEFKFDDKFKFPYNRTRCVIFNNNALNLKSLYFPNYEWIISPENIQDSYDNFFSNSEKRNISLLKWFEFGVTNVDEEYLFYIKLQHQEIFKDLEVIEIE